MKMIDFDINIDNYLINSGAYKCHGDVIAYTKEFYQKMKDFEREKYLKFFNDNNIPITDFLNIFISKSQKKKTNEGTEILTPQEINKVFSDLLVYNEFLKFLLEDKMKIESINSSGDLIYTISEEVREYFKDKYNTII